MNNRNSDNGTSSWMTRAVQVIVGIVGVLLIIFITTEIWARTESIIFLIALTCTFPFAVVYIITGRFVQRKRPMIALIILVIIGGMGMLISWGNQFNEPGAGFTPIEQGFLMNVSTEVIGAAIILVMLLLARNIGHVILFLLTIGFVLMIEQTTGSSQDVVLNLSTELLGSLLTTLIIYRFVERFDDSKR